MHHMLLLGTYVAVVAAMSLIARWQILGLN
jgi:hypothetical protein